MSRHGRREERVPKVRVVYRERIQWGPRQIDLVILPGVKAVGWYTLSAIEGREVVAGTACRTVVSAYRSLRALALIAQGRKANVLDDELMLCCEIGVTFGASSKDPNLRRLRELLGADNFARVRGLPLDDMPQSVASIGRRNPGHL